MTGAWTVVLAASLKLGNLLRLVYILSRDWPFATLFQ